MKKVENIEKSDNNIIDKLMLFCVTNKKEEMESILKQNDNLNLNIGNNKGFTLLHVASLRGYEDIVSLLIDNGANVLIKDKDCNTALHLASANGYLGVVKILINSKENKEYKGKLRRVQKGYKLSISKYDNLDNVLSMIEEKHKIYINKKWYLNSKNKNNDTALHLACKNNHEKVVCELLANGIIVNKKNTQNMTPLDYACNNENKNIVKMLINHMSRNDIEDEFKEACQFNKEKKVKLMLSVKEMSISQNILNECLFFAVISEYDHIVDVLSENGANINATDERGKTPIFWAINKGILLKLINKGAYLDWKDKNNETALFCNTVIGAYEDIIKTLLDKKANIDEENGSEKRTALHAACFYKQNFNIMKILLDYKADIYKKNSEGNNAIHVCCGVQNINALKYIFEKKENVNLDIKNEKGNTPLHIAVSLPNKEISELLIKKGAKLDLGNYKGETPLHIAVCMGHKEIAEMLIKYGADVNIENLPGFTPIFYACNNGDFAMVNLLVEYGAKVDLKSKSGITPLQCACNSKNKDIVNKFLDMGVDIAMHDENGMNTLSIAIQFGNKEIQNLLMDTIMDRIFSVCKKGTKKDFDSIVDNKLQIPENVLSFFLTVACYNNNFEIARILIEKGANLNKSFYMDEYELKKQGIFVLSKKERSPLHMAAKKGYKEIVELLVQNGADIMLKDRFGYTPLSLIKHHKNLARRYKDLSRYNKNLEVIKILTNEVEKKLLQVSKTKDIDIRIIKEFVKQNINVNLEDEFGNTPIVYACKNGRYDIVEYFLKNGINLRRDKHVKKMLINACDSESINILELLIQNGLSINILYKNAMTLLMYACKNSSLSVVKYLTTKYKDLNTKDKFGKTAIMYAVQGNRLDVVKYLIKQGADINCKDEDNISLLMHACKLGYADLIKYLLNNEVDIYVMDNFGNNALSYVCMLGKMNIVKYFTSCKNLDSDYVLKACYNISKIEEKQINIVKYLIEKVVKLLDDREKDELFMNICKIGNLDLLKLVNKKDIMKCTNKEGETILMCACEFGYKDIVEYLLDIKVNIYAIDNYGNNALAYACIFGYEDIVKCLIKSSNNNLLFIHHENKYGITPLMYACDMLQACCEIGSDCKEKQIDIVNYLVDDGSTGYYYDKIKNEDVKSYIKKKYDSLCTNIKKNCNKKNSKYIFTNKDKEIYSNSRDVSNIKSFNKH